MKRNRHPRPPVQAPSAFVGFSFPPDVILVAVRWFLRYGLSCRDLEELLAERGIEVDHVTLYRWVQRLTPELIDAAPPCRRAVDQHCQVIDVFVSKHRDIPSARRFFITSLMAHRSPVEVITDHGRLKARLRPVRGLKTDRTASVVIQGHAFVQNLRRGHYELGIDAAPVFRLATAFDELQLAI